MKKERPDENPYCRCLFFAANALARNITRLGEKAFAPSGLAPSMGFVLMTVNRQPGIQPSEVAAIMLLSPSTVSRFVEKLEVRGLVRRETQGKVTFIHPTRAGRQLNETLLESWRRTYQAYVSRIGEEESRLLTDRAYRAARILD